MERYFECTDCWKWSKAPEKFSERRHFVRCPECGKPMYMTPGKPEDVGMGTDKEVVGTLMRQD